MRISRLEPVQSPQPLSRDTGAVQRRDRKKELLALIRDKSTRGAELVAFAAELREDHLLEDLKEYRTVLHILIDRRQPKEALALWEELLEFGQIPNVKDYMLAMKAATKGLNWKAAMGILEDLRSNNVPEDEMTFMQAISAAKACKQWELAVHLLNSMPDVSISPNVFIYNGVLGACSRSRNWPAAEMVRKDMEHWGVVPDKTTYNTLISAASWAEDQGHIKALDLYAELKSKFPKQDIKSTTSIMAACSRWGRWELALDLFYEGKRDWMMPNHISYNAVISGCPPDAWQAVLALFDHMREPVKPDLYTLNQVVKACEVGGRWQEALKALAGMKEFTDSPPDETYDSIIRTCTKLQEEGVADDLRKEKDEKGEVKAWVLMAAAR